MNRRQASLPSTQMPGGYVVLLTTAVVDLDEGVVQIAAPVPSPARRGSGDELLLLVLCAPHGRCWCAIHERAFSQPACQEADADNANLWQPLGLWLGTASQNGKACELAPAFEKSLL